MELIKMVDEYLVNPYTPPRSRSGGAWYPSQASCIIKNEYGEDETVGQCARCMYWYAKNVKKTNPMTARGARICAAGKLVEENEVNLYKEMGIWRGNSVKFYNPAYKISGEVDAFVYDNDTKQNIGIEIKTGYGYPFQKNIIGTKTRKGMPKLDHLMQTMLYVDHFKLAFKMVCIDRGNAARIEFNITLNDDGTPNVNDVKLENGLSVPAIISRYKEVGKCLNDGVLPERDYELKYSQEKQQFLYDSNRMTKTQKTEFDRRGKVDMGDWRCSFCDYKDYCWKEKNK